MTSKFPIFFHSKKQRKAFSFIEISVVILVIGILVGGILASRAIIYKSRIASAQTLTISSPVTGISDSVLWLESSLDKSFNSGEASDTASLTAWYDIRESVNKNNATQSTTVNSPTYSNTINFIPAVKFDGTNGYFSFDGSVLNNTNYTIFVVESRESNKSSNYFIGDSSSGNEATSNKNLVLGYSADGTIKHSQSSDNSYTSSISTYSESSGKPRIFSFVHDKSVGKKTYISGLLAGTSTNNDHLSGLSTLKIGGAYQGQIGEIIVFARALTTEERQSVEDYLGKKWSSTILRNVVSSSIGGSCTGGIVTNTGCNLTCTVPTTNGITTTLVGSGSGTLTCDTSNHFTGSISYSCTDGTYSVSSGSCSCDTGYSASGSTCIVSTCSFSGVTGITDGTSVNYGSGSVSCGTGYSGTISYTCAGGGGSPTVTSGSCALTPCTGGTVVTVSGTTTQTFTASGTLTCTTARTAKVLVVGGGGGAGNNSGSNQDGGGGGGGGVVYAASYNITAGSHTVTVGAGGAASTTAGNGNGGNSVFDSTITAYGGGAGGLYANTAHCTGYSGGSGGGGGGCSAGYTTTGGSSTQTAQSGETAHYGNAGGNGQNGSPYSGAGGGGAGGAGESPAVTTSPLNYRGGAGGAGINIPAIDSNYYGGGGGGIGGKYGTSGSGPWGGAGGTGGGGTGGTAYYSTTVHATSGTANTGGGGGGGGDFANSGSGGSGVVIIKY